MLKLLKNDKAFIPAKRNFDRKPTSEVYFKENKIVHKVIISNN